ncbi:MAG: hypothetical protein OXE99_13065 [Cellvibrionales bacterium]|nr:hypothetical protein [Cellvibrionales bacterium]
MSSYKILFRGEITEEGCKKKAKHHFANQFKISKEQTEKIFTGKSVILKKGLSESDAVKWQAGLKKLGLITHPQAEELQAEKLQTKGQTTQSSRPLNEKQTFENKKVAATATKGVQTKNIDQPKARSEIQIQPHGKDLLTETEKAKTEPKNIDRVNTSHLSAEMHELPLASVNTEQRIIDTSHLQAMSYDVLSDDAASENPTISTDHLSLID